MQVKRRDFTAASVMENTIPDDYVPGDMMEFRMGCRSQDCVRLTAGVVPSVHTVASFSPPSAAASGFAMTGVH